MGLFAKLAEEMDDIFDLAWQEVWLYADDCSEIIRNMPHHRRRRVSQAVIVDMLEDQRGICPLCGLEIDLSTVGAFHVDHVIPFIRGGGYEANNLQITHPSCNISKADFASLYDLVPYLEQKASEFD